MQDSKELWFITGSQHLYGTEVLEVVEKDSQEIVEGLSQSQDIPVKIMFKAVVATAEQIEQVCLQANSTPTCIGVIVWMHTFSPAKMWIAGLKALSKPLLHLHTQFNRDIPWDSIDMDFMNLNQSAHGDREFGFMASRMHINRKVVVGYWQDSEVQQELGDWARAALAWDDSQHLKIARFGDNMRDVAVTEGNKVSAQMKFGYSVNGYSLGDLAAYVTQVSDAHIDSLIEEYVDLYHIQADLKPGQLRNKELREAARIEAGLRAFLDEGGFKAFTTTFENLNGLAQLPGLAVQRLMADGYGFGAEGDWKTAALVRAMKVMSTGLPGGTSFMEDYTYHLEPGNQMALGAHMLEVCSSIANGKPSLEMHPLGIGGKADPARLVFNVAPNPAINVSIIDMGDRFRMLVNEVEVVDPLRDLPALPVARVVWKPLPSLKIAAAAWILAGGAHHTAFSQALTTQKVSDFAEIADIEMIVINNDTELVQLKKELRWNEMVYRFAG
ncbi:MAG TPA: L-arabinose isomerase [Anaerolineaceae bacterium]|nr:L-arabinose isomerase [Anaerolineaceae bacterium]